MQLLRMQLAEGISPEPILGMRGVPSVSVTTAGVHWMMALKMVCVSFWKHWTMDLVKKSVCGVVIRTLIENRGSCGARR